MPSWAKLTDLDSTRPIARSRRCGTQNPARLGESSENQGPTGAHRRVGPAKRRNFVEHSSSAQARGRLFPPQKPFGIHTLRPASMPATAKAATIGHTRELVHTSGDPREHQALHRTVTHQGAGARDVLRTFTKTGRRSHQGTRQPRRARRDGVSERPTRGCSHSGGPPLKGRAAQGPHRDWLAPRISWAPVGGHPSLRRAATPRSSGTRKAPRPRGLGKKGR